MPRATFRYAGSKTRALANIYQFIPNVREAYEFILNWGEPFCGTAVATLNKDPHPLETINDINGDLVNFFKVLRDHKDVLIEKLALTPYARAELSAAAYAPDLDPIEQARRFYVRQNMSFNTEDKNPSFYRRKSIWRRDNESNVDSSIAHTFSRLDYLYAYAERLSLVQIENLDATQFIKDFGGEYSLLYLDAPYLTGEGDGRQNKTLYPFELLGEDQHVEFLEALINGGSYAIVSHYDHPLYNSVLKGWKKHFFTAGTMGKAKVEALYISPNLTELNRMLKEKREAKKSLTLFSFMESF